MVNVIFADNAPIVLEGYKSFFSQNNQIKIALLANTFEKVTQFLEKNKANVLVFDIDLVGFNTVLKIKELVRNNPLLNILIFSNVSDTMYAPPAIKAGAKGYLSKNETLLNLEQSILQVNNGHLIFSHKVKENLEILIKTKKSDRLFKKLSNREIEVLRHFAEGKKNNEIGAILALDEKTISTYKLRLLKKLGVTNLLDLINKAKELKIIG